MAHIVSRVPTRRLALAMAVSALFFATAALAAPPVNTLTAGLFGGQHGIAILGYDPVAYFTEGKPAKGQDRFVHEWMGAKWKFASQRNLDLFRADPARYAPQYGGYCAYGVAQDNLVSIEPDKFSVIDGKLYLNYDAEVQAIWLRDPARYIRRANTKFKTLLQQ